MPVLTIEQQSDWGNNIYVLSTARVFVGVGVISLLKSLYHIVQRLHSTHALNPIIGRSYLNAAGCCLQDHIG